MGLRGHRPRQHSPGVVAGPVSAGHGVGTCQAGMAAGASSGPRGSENGSFWGTPAWPQAQSSLRLGETLSFTGWSTSGLGRRVGSHWGGTGPPEAPSSPGGRRLCREAAERPDPGWGGPGPEALAALATTPPTGPLSPPTSPWAPSRAASASAARLRSSMASCRPCRAACSRSTSRLFLWLSASSVLTWGRGGGTDGAAGASQALS